MRRREPRFTCASPDRGYRYRDGAPLDTAPGYHPHKSTRFLDWGVQVAPKVAGRELPELYRDRSECCGCTACVFACPVGAISMEDDEEGFLYPVVRASLCIRCGRCMSACVFKRELVDRWDG